MAGMLKVRDPADPTGATWINIVGVGPQGPPGQTSVIIGNFGAITTPADLPADGILPVDWDGPGKPANAYQMVAGQSLYYEKPADPLDGHLFQFVGTGLNATGWIDIGLIQGPPGPTGPVGPGWDEVSIGDVDPLTANPQAEMWLNTAVTPPVLYGLVGGIWVPVSTATGGSEEVFVDPENPDILDPANTMELWYDVDAIPTGSGGGGLPAGGTTGQPLLKVSNIDGDADWGGTNLVMDTGKVIQFPNQADVAKINLYSTTFGFGIESGTLTAYSSSNFRFRQNSITGTQFANIHATGMEINSGHLYFPTDGHGVRFNGNGYIYKRSGGGICIRKHTGNTNIKIENNDGGGGQDIVTVSGNQNCDFDTISHSSSTQTSFSVISGSNGSNSSHYYVDCDSNAAGYTFHVLEARRLNLTTVFQLKGYIQHDSGDAHAKLFVNKGSEGTDEVWQACDYGDGQSTLHVHGPCQSTHFQDNNRSEMVAGTMAPVDPALVGQLIDAVQPIMFARNFRSSKATDGNEPGFVRPHHDPIPTLGFDTIAPGPLADRLLGPEEGGYSVGGMLAVAIAELKSLRARVAQLEGGQ